MSDDSIKSGENDFEVVGFSDCESSVGQEHQEATVVLQLPNELQNSDHLASDDTASSAASSFVAVQQHHTEEVATMPVENHQDDGGGVKSSSVAAASDASSWSHLSMTCGGTMEESSVISAFDIISISGGKNLTCQRCTFVNQENEEACVLCDTPLGVTPGLDVDHQLALHYQQEEDFINEISEGLQSTTSADKLPPELTPEELAPEELAPEELTPEERRRSTAEHNISRRVDTSMLSAKEERRRTAAAYHTKGQIDTTRALLLSGMQLAMHYKEEEEEEHELCEISAVSATADDLTLEERRALYSSMLLEEQATQLSHEIIECVNRIRCSGMAAFALSDLVAHSTSFISEMRALRGNRAPRVLLRYHFSNESTTGTYETIRKQGFIRKTNCNVSTNIEAAYYHDKRRPPATARIRIPESSMHLDTWKRGGWVARGGRGANLRDRQRGWIVAAIDAKAPFSCGIMYQTQSVKVSSGWAAIEHRSGRYCLPLASFDASLRESDSIRRLMNGLSEVFRVSELFVPIPEAARHEKEEELTNDGLQPNVLDDNVRGSLDPLSRAPGTEEQNPFQFESHQTFSIVPGSSFPNAASRPVVRRLETAELRVNYGQDRKTAPNTQLQSCFRW